MGSDVAALEKPSTRRRGVSQRLDPEARERAAVAAGSHRQCSVVDMFSETALEESFTAAEGDINGLDPEARDGRRCEREPPAMYTGQFVQSRWPWRSRPRRRQGESGSERVSSRDLGRGGNRRSRGHEFVTIGVQATVPCWTWQAPTGLADACEKSQRKPKYKGSPGGNRPVQRASGLVTVRVH